MSALFSCEVFTSICFHVLSWSLLKVYISTHLLLRLVMSIIKCYCFFCGVFDRVC